MTPPPSFWADVVDTPAERETEPQWMLDMAKHTLAEQMASVRDRVPLGILERFSRDDKGRVDMSYRRYPTSELPPGHRWGRPAKGIGKGYSPGEYPR